MYTQRTIFFLCLCLYHYTYQVAVPYVNPQIGENIWHLSKDIGIATDYLIDQEAILTATVNNIFLLSQDIEQGVNDVYALSQSIHTLVEECCVCTAFLDSTNTPTVITASGIFCLTQDIVTTNSAIIIAANNVILDLHGHTITANNGDAIVTGTGTNIIIKTGTVTALNGIGVNLGGRGTTTNITILDMYAIGSNLGFFTQSNANNIRYNRCEALSCILHGFAGNPSPTPNVYQSCKAIGNGLDGFRLINPAGTLSRLVLEDCIADRNRDGFGFYITSFNGFNIVRCNAIDNGWCGFYIDSLNGIVSRCTATTNGFGPSSICAATETNGFYFGPSTTGITVIACGATANAYGGFTSQSATNRFYNNYSIRNSTGGLNFNINASSGVVKTMPDLIANNNLSYWVNMDGGFLWNALCP